MTKIMPLRSPARPVLRARRLAPILAGLGLLTAGIALWRTKPGFLALPDPQPMDDSRAGGFLKRSARRSRDVASHVAPDNLGVSLGRSMAIAGTALLVTRILDELASRGD